MTILNPRVFASMFTEILQKYLTRFSSSNFKQPKVITKATSFAISSGGSNIWKSYLHEFGKTILSLPLILNELKNKLLEFEDELAFFQANQIEIDHGDINLRTLPSRYYVLSYMLL